MVRRRTFKRRSDWRGDRLFERVVVTGTDGGEISLLIKYAGRARGTDRSIEGLAREGRVYREYLEAAGLGTPKYVAAQASPDGTQHTLITEFVRGRRLKRVEEERVWGQVAGWLGDMHQRFLGSEARPEGGNGDGSPSLVSHDADFFWNAAERLVRALPSHSSRMRELGRSILSRYEKVAHGLGSAPRTLVHGEFYCTNILVVEDGADDSDLRVCPFDWETAAIGCGALDLAHLLRHELPIDRRFLIDAYLDRWEGDTGPTRHELEALIDRARIHELMYLTWLRVTCDSISQETLKRRLTRLDRELRGL